MSDQLDAVGVRQGVILAAGRGTRMAPVTDHIAKPMLPFFGAPLLDHAASHLVEAGVHRIAVNCHHLWQGVARHVHEVLSVQHPGVQWHVSHEEELLGTGGALANLSHWLDEEPFWVVNSDAVFAQPLREMEAVHRARGWDATWLLTRAEHARALRVVERDGAHRIGQILSSPDDTAFVFCGIHLTGPGLLAHLPDRGASCVIREGYLPWRDGGGAIGGIETTAFWADTGTPERYLDAHVRGFDYLERWRELRRNGR